MSATDQGRPFVFFGCIELREILGSRARDERELMEGLEQVSQGSVYHHTHGVFLHQPRVTSLFPNDFADWVASQIRDEVLAERLSMVDPFQFQSLEELRDELVSIIDQHISTLHPVPRVVFGDPFFFLQSTLIPVPTGLEARTLAEFRRCLADVDASAIFYHALDARIRRREGDEDFTYWIGQELGRASLAEEIRRINPYLGGLEQMRFQILRVIDAELARETPSGES
jgi:hypothetical protein